MLEKDIENLIAAHPDDIFPGEGFRLIGQQVMAGGRRLDILFEDRHQRRVIVEVKRGILSREASGQIGEYYGLLKTDDPDGNYELILCANVIPKERRTFLETIGIIDIRISNAIQWRHLERRCFHAAPWFSSIVGRASSKGRCFPQAETVPA